MQTGPPITEMVSLIEFDTVKNMHYGGYCYASPLPDGSWAFAWEGNHPDNMSNNVINVQIFDSLLNPVSSRQMANDVPEINRNSIIPIIACRDNGDFVVSWTDNRNSYSNLWTQRFDLSGNPVGKNYRINTPVNSVDDGRRDAWVDIHDNKAVFVWRDGRNFDNYGPDIFAELIDFEQIGIYIPGDVNLDGLSSLADVIYLIDFIFKGETLFPLHSADVNGDCSVTLSDVIGVVNSLFKPPGR